MIESGQARRVKVMLNGHSRGFTLLELLIALTIVAVIVVIVFGALRIGIRAWEKGERDVNVRQRQRIVLDLIKRQLVSISLSEVRGKDRQLLSLKGDAKSIEFVSHLPITPGIPFGLVYVKYAVKPVKGDDREHLTFYEKNVALFDEKTSTLDDSNFSELLSGMKSIVFEYLKDRPGEAESPWQKSWDPAVDKGVPRAVRVTLTENDEKAPVSVIAGAGE